MSKKYQLGLQNKHSFTFKFLDGAAVKDDLEPHVWPIQIKSLPLHTFWERRPQAGSPLCGRQRGPNNATRGHQNAKNKLL